MEEHFPTLNKPKKKKEFSIYQTPKSIDVNDVLYSHSSWNVHNLPHCDGFDSEVSELAEL